MRTTGGRFARAVSLIGAVMLVLGACSSGGGGTSGEERSQGPVELDMWLFGDFGYDPLIKQYQKDHPNVTIKTRIAEYNEHHDSLTAALAAGSGAPDIAAIEVGFISAFKAQPEHFHNLLELGAGELEGNYLDWKWQQALTGDGSALIGLPTDVGGMAMAYRWDLFRKAGLPFKRDEVSAMWPTWEDFLAQGERFTQATGVPFVDEGSQLYNAIVNQGEAKYYEPDNSVIYESNPQVRKAWDLTTQAITDGLVANIEPFAAEWNTAMNKGDFAVLTAPAWMMGYIQEQAPDTEGRWDIASMPEGGGNWGGSHLALPAQGEHPREAFEFISWLLAPEQQLQVFRDTGNFPSTPDAYDEPPIQNFRNAFFNNAPVGPIYADNALEVTPIYEGPQEGAIRLAFENALDRVEDGTESPEQAWNSALEEIAREVGN
jgi:cellobiose transport system substrate-binding protein